MIGTSINNVPVRNIYGSAGGPTLGSANSPITPFDGIMGSQSATTTADGGTVSTAAVAAAGTVASKGILGQPFSWFILLIFLLMGLRFVAGKLGGGEEFKSVRVSIHNVVIISLASIIGIGFFKVVFNKWQVPGLTTFINSV